MYRDVSQACRDMILFIWCDLLSIPQRSLSHGGRSAVNSLPAYVQHCGQFYVLHGEPGQLAHGRQCDPSFSEYLSGGWTRQEVMTAQCPVRDKSDRWSNIRTYTANFDTRDVQVCSLASAVPALADYFTANVTPTRGPIGLTVHQFASNCRLILIHPVYRS